jgi:nucleoside-diphosphate-sugar epimerase
MKVLVAGGTGAVGRPLVRQLEEAGHEAVAVGRSSKPVAMDALDAESVREAVAAARPEAIVNQLTAIPDPIDPRKMAQQFEPTNRLRREGTANLMAAAKEYGVRRAVAQSIAFAYAPTGGGAWTEEDRLFTEAGEIVGAVEALERQTLDTEGVEGIVLRYGFFYGPGTTYAPDGGTAETVRKRQFPIIGKGTGVFSFIHVEDAAAATVAALEHGAPGIYNVVDDDPAPVREYLPVLAEVLGAKRPFRIPKFVGRLAAGRLVVHYSTTLQPASNEKAKRELGWQPSRPSWRQGFRETLT